MPGYHVHYLSFARFSATIDGSMVHGPAARFPFGTMKEASGRYCLISTKRQDIRFYDIWIGSCSADVAIPEDGVHQGSLCEHGELLFAQELFGSRYELWTSSMVKQPSHIAHVLSNGRTVITRVYSNFEGGLDFFVKSAIDPILDLGLCASRDVPHSILGAEWVHWQKPIVSGAQWLNPYRDAWRSMHSAVRLGSIPWQWATDFGHDDLCVDARYGGRVVLLQNLRAINTEGPEAVDDEWTEVHLTNLFGEVNAIAAAEDGPIASETSS